MFKEIEKRLNAEYRRNQDKQGKLFIKRATNVAIFRFINPFLFFNSVRPRDINGEQDGAFLS